jgi:hypothetical protein
MNALRPSRSYRVTGAHHTSGKEMEITVAAFDEADATRTANRQGIFVSGCVAAAAEGSSGGGNVVKGRLALLMEQFRRASDATTAERNARAQLLDELQEVVGLSNRMSTESDIIRRAEKLLQGR